MMTLRQLKRKFQTPLSNQDTFTFLSDYQSEVCPKNKEFEVVINILLVHYVEYEHNNRESCKVARHDMRNDDWKFWFHKLHDLRYLMEDMVRMLWETDDDPYCELESISELEEKYELVR